MEGRVKQFGFVYLLGNHCMPGIYKIGCTEKSPHLRAAQLSDHTGVPEPFHVICFIEVDDHQAVERGLHAALQDHRVSANREFFRVSSLAEAVGYFQHYPEGLSFTDVRASEMLGLQGIDSVPNPWPAADFSDVDFGGSGL